ncbi:hypothetical protein BYT27DRAFT_7264841 [Phlegmacium glaucopus]|nr:hypothetical protein BYT27DRAFT_7264841 [Phlegmacium glaucopus]
MRKVVPDYETPYPNIAANVLKGPPHYATTPGFELFNDTTREEYHCLFIDLVSQYQHFVDLIATKAKEEKAQCRHGYDPLGDPVEADTVTTTLWEPFKSWIMLMLIQLDAADALCDFITKVELSHAQIKVKLVYPSLVSDKTIPLEELLTQTKYIPEVPIADPKTNAKLLDFIITANTLKKQVVFLENFKKNWDPMHASKGKEFIQQVLDEARKEHKEDGDQGIDSANKIIIDLSDKIIKLLSQPVQDANILVKFTDLEGQLKERQAKYNLPFNEKTTFRGAVHCEAALASILDKTTREGIQAWIQNLKLASGKKFKDEQLYESLSKLLKETELIPVQFTMVGLHPPQSPALSRQVFTTPSRAARGWHECNFWTASEKRACEALR